MGKGHGRHERTDGRYIERERVSLARRTGGGFFYLSIPFHLRCSRCPFLGDAPRDTYLHVRYIVIASCGIRSGYDNERDSRRLNALACVDVARGLVNGECMYVPGFNSFRYIISNVGWHHLRQASMHGSSLVVLTAEDHIHDRQERCSPTPDFTVGNHSITN
jgi:hypothetical protein